jgi:CotH kinase protein
VGLRPKGGASRTFVKKSWKISLSKFVHGRRWYQQQKVSLKAMSMTPSFVRALWTRDLLYSMGAPALRMSYAQLYLNGAYRGLYVLQEVCAWTSWGSEQSECALLPSG